MAAGGDRVSDDVREAFRRQAGWCLELGSPFTSRLLTAVAAVLDERTAIGRRVLGWGGDFGGRADAVPLRLAGGLHALVRRDALPALTPLYPPHSLPEQSVLEAALTATFIEHGPDLDPYLDSAPQTNEVARSAALMAGLLVVAARTGLPIALHELGASAGLNLRLDAYGYDLGGVRVGDPASAVQLAPGWHGAPPPSADLRVARRRGVDLNPLDVRNVDEMNRMLGYIWPDQQARLDRARKAIALAAADPPPIDREDAASWTERVLDVAPERGIARVLLHSIAFQYFPAATQTRIATHVARVGAEATADAPFAWLRLELDARYGTGAALLLTLWPDGAERLLATCSPHVRAIRWQA